MTTLIESETRLGAWLLACKFLLNDGYALNIILSIKNPASNGSGGAAATERINQYLKSEDEFSLHTVAETIFPAWEYRRSGFGKLKETYIEDIFPKIKSAPGISWGTYAYRLLHRKKFDGTFMNPLENVIKKMKDEAAKAGPKRACYEVGMAEGAYDRPLDEGGHDVPFYSTGKDSALRRGGPCLSHLSFKLLKRKVHLTALYRSHDYSYKTLGNLLGLARLQACVASEVGVGIGSLVIHSTYATLEVSPKMRRLLDDVKKILMIKSNPRKGKK